VTDVVYYCDYCDAEVYGPIDVVRGVPVYCCDKCREKFRKSCNKKVKKCKEV